MGSAGVVFPTAARLWASRYWQARDSTDGRVPLTGVTVAQDRLDQLEKRPIKAIVADWRIR